MRNLLPINLNLSVGMGRGESDLSEIFFDFFFLRAERCDVNQSKRRENNVKVSTIFFSIFKLAENKFFDSSED